MLPAVVEVALYRALKRANNLWVVFYADRKAVRDGRVIEACARLEERLRARCRWAVGVYFVYLLWKLGATAPLADIHPLPVLKLVGAAAQAFLFVPLLVFLFRRQHLRVAGELRAVLDSLSPAAIEDISPSPGPALRTT